VSPAGQFWMSFDTHAAIAGPGAGASASLESYGLTHFGRPGGSSLSLLSIDSGITAAQGSLGTSGTVPGGSICHGQVGEGISASRWSPVRSTCRPRRRAQSLFACTRV
jgi:hypothetical protein